MLRIHVLATGTELLRGRGVDTNLGWIGRTLEPCGMEIRYAATVGDDLARIVDELKLAAARAEVGIMSGGLGPTEDDLTRHAIEKAFHRPLHFDRTVFKAMEARFRNYKIPMARSNRRQALIPEGAHVMPNPHGSAAGFWVDIDGFRVFCLPGPPREMQPMFTKHVLPILRRLAGRPGLSFWEGRSIGMTEAHVGEIVERIVGRRAVYGLTAKPGLVTIWVRAEGARRKRTLQDLSRRIRRALGRHFLAEGERSLEEVVAGQLVQRRTTIALAESCTGGLIAHKLTQVPGISKVLLEALVTYSNESKVRRLGVPEETIRRHGAVSEETAAAMAEGVARTSGARMGVATTGIAGPTGGSKEKPIGLVVTAVCHRGRTMVQQKVFSGERSTVKERAATQALLMVRQALTER